MAGVAAAWTNRQNTGPGTTPKAAGRAGVRETQRRDQSKGVPEDLWILGGSVEWGGGWDRKLRDSPCSDT